MTTYLVHGLKLLSPVELAELESRAYLGDERPEIVLAISRLVQLQQPEELRLVLRNIDYRDPLLGRIQVCDGTRISLTVAPELSDRLLRFALYARALPLLLYQRRILPLHASAVIIQGSAAVFVGGSGFGKSSLAAASIRFGAAPFSDDILVAEPSARGAIVHSGVQQLHLSEEVAQMTGHALPNPGDRFGAKGKNYYTAHFPEKIAYPIGAIYMLEWGEDEHPCISRVGPFPALMALRECGYHHDYIQTFGLESEFLARYSRITATVPVFRFRREKNIEKLHEQARLIAEHFKALPNVWD